MLRIAAAAATLLVQGASAQGASQIGGRPPTEVETELCSIATVFTQLQAIKDNDDCKAGCGNEFGAHGAQECGNDWYPGGSDECNALCGQVFEPFWDTCGAMLTEAHMGGMDEMGAFYDSCLESLYPPGSCGTFCNGHTYDCYRAEIEEACCDEEGTNCPTDTDVPNTCRE